MGKNANKEGVENNFCICFLVLNFCLKGYLIFSQYCGFVHQKWSFYEVSYLGRSRDVIDRLRRNVIA